MAETSWVLTPDNYDGVVSALLGNGELCTTVCPTGYHTPPDQQTDAAHRTQHFVLAGRRRNGPQHPLLNLGCIWCTVILGGQAVSALECVQGFADLPDFSDPELFNYWLQCWRSHGNYGALFVHTTSQIALNRNLFSASTFVLNPEQTGADAILRVEYAFGEPDADLTLGPASDHVTLSYRIEGHVGDVLFGANVSGESQSDSLQCTNRGMAAELCIPAGSKRTLHTWIHFSDRLQSEFPVDSATVSPVLERQTREWAGFWSRSEVLIGCDVIDEFRRRCLYTLRCQATPWSIPATLSEPYWGAGAFHDEMYPFLALLSANHAELAERVPYFRLATLPQAIQRARGRGALYPWSSTEFGEERDPNGLWLTERFHLGQFAVCIWMLWLYNRDLVQLDDLYPVLREIARYFEMNMLERDSDGRLGTKPCVDFDESAGEVKNGPFTVCAAIASLEHAANAAELLGKDSLRNRRWRAVATELRAIIWTSDELPDTSTSASSPLPPVSPSPPLKMTGGAPLHYSILAPIFPFSIDINSPIARSMAEHIHAVLRSDRGWKPGFSEAFEGSSWMWTAGHLAIVHAMQGSGDLAWEAIRGGLQSAGPLLSPNEHVNRDGVIQVPWFTTGCGAWLYGLHCLFVQVDEEGTKLLPAIPKSLSDVRFRDLYAEHRVLVSGEFSNGRLTKLSARASDPTDWRFRIPTNFAREFKPEGKIVHQDDEWTSVNVSLPKGRDVSLLEFVRESTRSQSRSDPSKHLKERRCP